MVGGVTQLLHSWTDGDQSALDQLMPLVYSELKRVAASYLGRERGGHTLQPTALVHEAYMRLMDQSIADCHTRAHFFGIAARLMRQILVNHAERQRAAKRGGGNQVAFDEAAALVSGNTQALDVLALHDALNRLAQLDPRQSQIVELRFFGGLTEDEIAEVLRDSPRTVKRGWTMAKAWLHGELGDGDSTRAS